MQLSIILTCAHIPVKSSVISSGKLCLPLEARQKLWVYAIYCS